MQHCPLACLRRYLYRLTGALRRSPETPEERSCACQQAVNWVHTKDALAYYIWKHNLTNVSPDDWDELVSLIELADTLTFE